MHCPEDFARKFPLMNFDWSQELSREIHGFSALRRPAHITRSTIDNYSGTFYTRNFVKRDFGPPREILTAKNLLHRKIFSTQDLIACPTSLTGIQKRIAATHEKIVISGFGANPIFNEIYQLTQDFMNFTKTQNPPSYLDEILQAILINPDYQNFCDIILNYKHGLGFDSNHFFVNPIHITNSESIELIDKEMIKEYFRRFFDPVSLYSLKIQKTSILIENMAKPGRPYSNCVPDKFPKFLKILLEIINRYGPQRIAQQ